MDLRSKILRAINKGLNEALDIDDFSEDDLKIQKKSLSSIIKDSNYRNSILYYQDLMNEIMSKDVAFLSLKDIHICTSLYKEYNILYNPHLDEEKFKYFIKSIINKWGNDVNLNWIDTSEVTNMYSLFDYSDFNGDISLWNVSNVTNMEVMFHKSKFNEDISKWDVSHVTNMRGMFEHSKFNGDISNWDVSNVKDMSFAFSGSKFNGDISNWDVSNVTNMYSMFEDSAFEGNISDWDVSNVTNMGCMFERSKFNGDISEWNVSHVTNMSYMFSYSLFNSDVSKWKVSNFCTVNFIIYKCPIKDEFKFKGMKYYM